MTNLEFLVELSENIDCECSVEVSYYDKNKIHKDCDTDIVVDFTTNGSEDCSWIEHFIYFDKDGNYKKIEEIDSY